jgi:predicted RNA binding protein YcfA (HicA-like mRNA interferase family)
MVGFLKAQGFQLVRIRGSHHALARGALSTVVPVHASRQLKIGTIRAILQDIQMSAQEFVRQWEQR